MRTTSANSSDNGWAVYLCGCTDCFPQAVFVDKEEAYYWAEDHNSNPEGYLILPTYVKVFDES